MINAAVSCKIFENRFMSLPSLNFSPIEEAVNRLLERIKNSEEPRVSEGPIRTMDAVWGLKNGYYLQSSARSFMKSFCKLKKIVISAKSNTRSAEEISRVVKEVLRNLVDLWGCSALTIHWAHQTRFISVGKYAPLINFAGLSCIFIVKAIDLETTLSKVKYKKNISDLDSLGESVDKLVGQVGTIFQVRSMSGLKKEIITLRTHPLCALTSSVRHVVLTALKLKALFDGVTVRPYAQVGLLGFSWGVSQVTYALL